MGGDGWGNECTIRLRMRKTKKENALNMDKCVYMKDLEEEPLLEEDNIDKNKRRFDLDSLLEQITPENLHPEFETGPPRGKEVW